MGYYRSEYFRRDWKVIATMRNPEKETELNQLDNITLMPLDVTNIEQISATSEKAIALGDIDVVFNNAGYGLAGPLEGLTDDQLIRQINTNILGTLRTTQAFVPHFRKKRSGLFINTTSIGGLIALPLNSVYHATKWALEGWSESMAFELNPFGIGIKTVSPGGITTDFSGRSLDTGQHEAYEDIINKVMTEFNKPERRANYSTPEQIAEIVFEAATDGKDQLRYVAGEDAKTSYAQRLAVGGEAFRKGIKQMFSI